MDDHAGVTRPIRDRSAFDIERARLALSGFAIDERLTYFFHFDGDTDGAHTVDFFDYWWAWELTDGLQIQLGKRKVPGSRQWLLGARRTRFTERPMANDFFRPDRTVGIFGVGRLGSSGHFELMLGNGPLPRADLFQHGHYVEGGRFLIPKKLDVNGIQSRTHGGRLARGSPGRYV